MKSKSGKDHRRDKAMMEQVKANFEVDRNTRIYTVEFEGAKKVMTNKECERVLLTLLNAAWRVFKECHPDGTVLNMYSSEDGHCALGYVHGAAGIMKVVDGYLSPSGDYRFSR